MFAGGSSNPDDRAGRRLFVDAAQAALSLRNVPRHRAVIVLVVAAVGMVWFSRGIGLIDTVAVLACGLMAGGSLAALAAARQKTR